MDINDSVGKRAGIKKETKLYNHLWCPILNQKNTSLQKLKYNSVDKF